jgi:NitT/TauT family transport system permease protein
MIRQSIRERWQIVLGVAAMVVLAAMYTGTSYYQHHVVNPLDTTVPTWAQLWEGVQKIVEPSPLSSERWLLVDAKASGARLLAGLSLSVLGAIAMGVVMGCSKTCEAVFLPPLAFMAKVAATAMIGVLFVLLGTDFALYVGIIMFGVLPMTAQSVALAVRDVSDESLYKAYTLGASHAEVVWNVVVRTILPKLIDATRLAIGPAVIFLIAVEMVCGDVGFGYRIRLQARLLNMNVVIPYVVMVGLFGLAMDYALRFLQRKVCPWYEPQDRR